MLLDFIGCCCLFQQPNLYQMMSTTIFNPRSIITTVMTIIVLDAFLLTPLISDTTKNQIAKIHHLTKYD
jgi:hypothetical protein